MKLAWLSTEHKAITLPCCTWSLRWYSTRLPSTKVSFPELFSNTVCSTPNELQSVQCSRLIRRIRDCPTSVGGIITVHERARPTVATFPISTDLDCMDGEGNVSNRQTCTDNVAFKGKTQTTGELRFSIEDRSTLPKPKACCCRPWNAPRKKDCSPSTRTWPRARLQPKEWTKRKKSCEKNCGRRCFTTLPVAGVGCSARL